MEKVLFALGSRGIEEDIAKEIGNDYRVVGAVLRKGQIISAVKETRPDIMILRETLEGNENIRDIVLTLRREFPYVRIIFLAGHRDVGDKFLSILVTYGVYDILNGGKVTLSDIVGLVYSKNEYKDVLHLQPKVLFDEMGNMSFEMPEVVNIERKQVVIPSTGASKEVTEQMKKQLENEIMVKVQAQLRDEYNREFQLQLQKNGKMREQEIKQKLGEIYENKLKEEKRKIQIKMAEEIEAKAIQKLEEEKKIMVEKLKEKEQILRAQMEAKVSAAMKENTALKNKYESDTYEANLRKKLEIELRKEMEEESEKLESERIQELEEEKQRELENIKSQLIKDLEEKSKRVLADKEMQMKKEIEKKKQEEFAKEKKLLEEQQRKEMEEFKKSLEQDKENQVKQYEEKLAIEKDKLKKKLANNMNQKVKNEVDKVKNKLKEDVENREKALRTQMESKIAEIVNENRELKNKYETEEFENKVRAKLEKELKGELEKEKLAFQEELKRRIKEKEEELSREEASSLKKIEENAKKALKEREAEIEKIKQRELVMEKERLEFQSKNEIEKFKNKIEEEKKQALKSYDDQVKNHIKEIEKKSKEELKRIEESKQEEIRQMELRKKEEMKRIEIQNREELKRIEIQNQEELKRIEEAKQYEVREVKERLEKEQEEFIKNESQFNMKNNQKILSFLGGKNGVGTTTVAINVATELASSGYRVLFIELNPYTPSVGYWYQLDSVEKGIEVALKAIQDERYRDVEENVLKSKDLKKGEYGKYYKSFPDSLDFLLFSQQETLLKKERIQFNSNDLKNLYFYLMQHLGYEYIVLDLRVDEEDSWVTNSLLFSTKIYPIISQDVASIAYLKYRSELIQKNNIPIERKSSYVVNRFDSKGCKLNMKELKSFIPGATIFAVPDTHQDIMNAIYDGVPAVVKSRNKEFKKAINQIAKDITKK